ncbi:hypothetical protein C6Q28_10705 [Burkholderia multivorans]|uniref:Bacteriophage protein n=1 Tax=Burkholderia multivorans (strain ATCC 17616 / 249) TaxID=395019 RepID=A0A0H3KMQ2_BURM1|nr:gp16 [Burkholderia phage Bcep176]ABA60017.1 gp16 [Burkholderia phage Bcep176]PRF62438.1 hypothetical protein C6Q28_10705 [Burkholderia multivorans]BAG46505.1 bacteriophage protein [Burkholderia multivorans ATCC 17616]
MWRSQQKANVDYRFDAPRRSKRLYEGRSSPRVIANAPSFEITQWRPETETAHFIRHVESPCRSRSPRATSSAGRISHRTRRAYRRFMRPPFVQ